MPLFQTDHDAAMERKVAAELSRAWDCEVRHFGARDTVDMYALRDGSMVAILELKARKMPSTRYETVFLAMRKYIDLRTYAYAFGVHALFVVQYEDCLAWIDIADVDPSRHIIGGNSRNKAVNDIEPLIEVPVSTMTMVVE